jgi:hypothetical protein
MPRDCCPQCEHQLQGGATPEVLATILRSGIVPDQYCPHLITLLDEVPPSFLLVPSPRRNTEVSTDKINEHLLRWAMLWQI